MAPPVVRKKTFALELPSVDCVEGVRVRGLAAVERCKMYLQLTVGDGVWEERWVTLTRGVVLMNALLRQ